MKHVALLLPTIDHIGGAERQVLLLAQEFSARGWQVTVVALSGSGSSAASRLSDAGIAFLSLDMRKAWIDPRGWLRYIRWAARARPEIVHAHLPHAHWFARWVRLLAPVSVLVDTFHTSHIRGGGRYRWSNWLSDHVTCVSQSVADAAVSCGCLRRQRTSVLPNGVPMDSQVPLLPRSQPASSFLWIALGRLAPVKDYPTLLRAFATLQGNPRLLIAGSGPDDLMLHRLAIDLNIDHRVQFAGFQEEIQPLLAVADAFVLSSLWEGLPVSILEAQAAGLPVVATNGAGTAEAMIPGETGLLVPTSDPEALGMGMAQIMAMPLEARQRMGAQGREFVESNFSLSSIADRWEALYEALLQANPNPTRRSFRLAPLRSIELAREAAEASPVPPSGSEKANLPRTCAVPATPEPRDPRK